MQGIAIGIAIPVITTLILQLITTFLPREKTKKWGHAHGTIVSKFLRAKIGAKLENIIENTFKDYAEGFIAGLRADN